MKNFVIRNDLNERDFIVISNYCFGMWVNCSLKCSIFQIGKLPKCTLRSGIYFEEIVIDEK
jgi:hypothetical protein